MFSDFIAVSLTTGMANDEALVEAIPSPTLFGTRVPRVPRLVVPAGLPALDVLSFAHLQHQTWDAVSVSYGRLHVSRVFRRGCVSLNYALSALLRLYGPRIFVVTLWSAAI